MAEVQIAFPDARRKRFRFWLIYSIAWLPFAASYFTLFTTHFGRSYFEAVKGSLFNVLPAAGCGIGVVIACRRVSWSSDRRYRFLFVHAVLVSLYVAVWIATPPFLNAVDQAIKHRLWRFQIGESFQGGIITALMMYVAIAGIVYAIETNERLRLEEARRMLAESLRTRAELEALRAQLNPHFLFNILHSLMTLVRHDPLAAEDGLERLALLLRHTLMTMKDAEDVQLSDELDFVENYLALERLRLGDRLRIEKEIHAETLNCHLPPFTLQPLIENSIRHAISNQPKGGLLKIKTESRNGLLLVELVDDGPGADERALEASNGIGLRTVRQRLLTRYGDRVSFQVSTSPGKGFAVQIGIPTN
jgi:sensor histidine kinase YesM